MDRILQDEKAARFLTKIAARLLEKGNGESEFDHFDDNGIKAAYIADIEVCDLLHAALLLQNHAACARAEKRERSINDEGPDHGRADARQKEGGTEK